MVLKSIYSLYNLAYPSDQASKAIIDKTVFFFTNLIVLHRFNAR